MSQLVELERLAPIERWQFVGQRFEFGDIVLKTGSDAFEVHVGQSVQHDEIAGCVDDGAMCRVAARPARTMCGGFHAVRDVASWRVCRIVHGITIRYVS